MEVERRWRRGRLVPALYDFAVEHERLARLAGRMMWGADVSPLYRAFADPEGLPPGSAVLDVPCGGGLALRGLPPGVRPPSQETGPPPGAGRPSATGVRYVAADLSPVMLGRARAEAARRGVRVAFAQASVDRLPFPAGVFDLCVTYNGLHCFPDPASAVAEMARVLRPSGVLRGTSVVTGAGVRQDALIALFRRRGDFGAPGSADDLRGWLDGAALADVRVEPSGAVAFFTAAKPPA